MEEQMPAEEPQAPQGGGDIQAQVEQIGSGLQGIAEAFANPESGVPEEAGALMQQALQSFSQAIQLASGGGAPEQQGASQVPQGEGTPFGPAQQA